MATRNAYDIPTDTPVVDETRMVTVPWSRWIQRTHMAALATQQSGPSTQRPNEVLWLGRSFFDTTINKPIWIKQVKPVVVWVDATGGAV